MIATTPVPTDRQNHELSGMSLWAHRTRVLIDATAGVRKSDQSYDCVLRTFHLLSSVVPSSHRVQAARAA